MSAAARPFMTDLMELSGETVNLSIVDQGEIVYISQVESNEMMRMIVNLGLVHPFMLRVQVKHCWQPCVLHK